MDVIDVETICSKPHQWVMSFQKSQSIRQTPTADIVRSFMQEEMPYFKTLTVNKIEISSENLLGANKNEKRLSYFKRVLQALYHAAGNEVDEVEVSKTGFTAYFIRSLKDYSIRSPCSSHYATVFC